MWSRSTTPRKSPSAPIGSCTSATVASRRSLIMSTQRKKSAPTRSILLTKHMRGHVVLVGLAPHGLGLGLDAGDGVEHGDGAVEHPQRPFDLDGEVDMPGRVDDVDPRVAPLAGRGGAGDGDAALLLLDHPVHDRGAFVDLADLVGTAGVVQDPFGGRGLAGVDVRHDPDVANPREGDLADQRAALAFDIFFCDCHCGDTFLVGDPPGVLARRCRCPRRNVGLAQGPVTKRLRRPP